MSGRRGGRAPVSLAAALARRQVRSGGGGDDDELLFTFEDDSSEEERPNASQGADARGRSSQQQPGGAAAAARGGAAGTSRGGAPAAPAAPAAAAAAAAAALPEHLQNLQQMRAMIDRLERAKAARQTRAAPGRGGGGGGEGATNNSAGAGAPGGSGALAAAKPRAKPLKRPALGGSGPSSGNSTPPAAPGGLLAQGAAAAAAGAPAAAGAALSGGGAADGVSAQLLEDLEYILAPEGEETADEERLQQLRLQVAAVEEAAAAVRHAAGEAAAEEGGRAETAGSQKQRQQQPNPGSPGPRTAAAAALSPTATPSKPVAVRKVAASATARSAKPGARPASAQPAAGNSTKLVKEAAKALLAKAKTSKGQAQPPHLQLQGQALRPPSQQLQEQQQPLEQPPEHLPLEQPPAQLAPAQLPVAQLTLLSVLMSGELPPSVAQLSLEQQHEALQLLAQQHRCLIQERLLRQEVAALQASWQQVGSQLGQLIGPEEAQQACAAVSVGAVGAGPQGAAVPRFLAPPGQPGGQVQEDGPAEDGEPQPSAAGDVVAAATLPTAALQDGPVPADLEQLVGQRTAELQEKRLRYEQQRLQLQAAARSSAPTLLALQLLAPTLPPPAAQGGSRKRQAEAPAEANGRGSAEAASASTGAKRPKLATLLSNGSDAAGVAAAQAQAQARRSDATGADDMGHDLAATNNRASAAGSSKPAQAPRGSRSRSRSRDLGRRGGRARSRSRSRGRDRSRSPAPRGSGRRHASGSKDKEKVREGRRQGGHSRSHSPAPQRRAGRSGRSRSRSRSGSRRRRSRSRSRGRARAAQRPAATAAMHAGPDERARHAWDSAGQPARGESAAVAEAAAAAAAPAAAAQAGEVPAATAEAPAEVPAVADSGRLYVIPSRRLGASAAAEGAAATAAAAAGQGSIATFPVHRDRMQHRKQQAEQQKQRRQLQRLGPLGWLCWSELLPQCNTSASSSASATGLLEACSSSPLHQLHQALHDVLRAALSIGAAAGGGSSRASGQVAAASGSTQLGPGVHASVASGAPQQGAVRLGPGSPRPEGTAAAAARSGSGSGSGSGAAGLPAGRYSSPLACFRAYRLAPQFAAVNAAQDPAGPSHCHAIDPQWPLCPHDSRGVHRDASCAWQHWADVGLSVSGVEQQLAALLQAAGVPRAAAVAAQWRADQVQRPAVAGKALLDAVAAAGVDWLDVLRQAGGRPLAGAGAAAPAPRAQAQARAVDPAARAAAVDAPSPAATVEHLALPERSGSGGGGGATARAAPRAAAVVPQQPALLAAAGACRGLQQQQQQQQQAEHLFPWAERLGVFDRPLPGLDLYSLPPEKQQEHALVVQQKSRRLQWLRERGAPSDHAQPRQRGGWRYFSSGTDPEGGFKLQGGEEAAAPAEGQAQGDGAQAAAASVATDAAAAAAVAAALDSVDRLFGRRLEREQRDPGFWVSWALASLDVMAGGGGGAAAAAAAAGAAGTPEPQQAVGRGPDVLTRAGSVLLRGFSTHAHRPELWLLQLALLLRRAGFGQMQATVLQRAEGFCSASYGLWLTAAHVQGTWQQQLAVWLKALAYLAAAAADPPGGAGAGAGPPEGLASCVLDIALRLVRCLCDAGAQELLAAWCAQLVDAAAQAVGAALPQASAVRAASAKASTSLQALLAEVDRAAAQQQQQQQQPGGAAQPPPPTAAGQGSGLVAAAGSAAACDLLAASDLAKLAAGGLVALLHRCPLHLATLWLSLAHAAACGALPPRVEARLQYPQPLLVLDAVEFGALSGAAAAAAAAAPTGGAGPGGLQLAGRLVQALAGSGLLTGAPICFLGAVRQQQRAWAAEAARARRAVVASILALEPFWQQLGLACSPGGWPAALTALLPAPQLGQDASPPPLAQDPVAAALWVIRHSLGERQEPQQQQQPDAEPVGTDGRGAAADIPLALHDSQALMRSVAELAAAEGDSWRQAANCASARLSAAVHALSRKGLLLHRQELWAALAAVAVGGQGAAAAAGAAAGTREQQQWLRRALLALLGAAASGLLASRGGGDGEGGGRELQAVIAGSAALPEPSEVRQAYRHLLGLGPEPGGAQQQQEQQQQPPGLLAATGAATAVQRCLAFANWASFEAALGEPGRAFGCLLAGVREASSQQQPQQQQPQQQQPQQQQPLLLALLHRQLLSLVASVASPGGGSGGGGAQGGELAVPAGPHSQQQARQGRAASPSTDSGPAGTGSLATALQNMLAVLAPAGGSLPPLQHPPLQLGCEETRRRLQAPNLVPHSPLLDAGLEVLLASCDERRQVVVVLELLVSSTPPSVGLLQLLLTVVRRHPGEAAWAAWLLPLLAGVCCACELPAPARLWAAVVRLARSASPSAAAQLARTAVRTHPWSMDLWRLHMEASASAEGGKDVARLADRHGLALLA